MIKQLYSLTFVVGAVVFRLELDGKTQRKTFILYDVSETQFDLKDNHRLIVELRIRETVTGKESKTSVTAHDKQYLKIRR